MAYATLTDLARFGLPSTALTGVSSAAQTDALEAASDVADSYLRARLAVPLTSWGTDLTLQVCVLAAEIILSTRGLDPSRANGDVILTRADRARAWLKLVAEGKVSVTGGVTTPAPGVYARAATAPTTRSNGERGW